MFYLYLGFLKHSMLHLFTSFSCFFYGKLSLIKGSEILNATLVYLINVRLEGWKGSPLVSFSQAESKTLRYFQQILMHPVIRKHK